MATPAYTTDTSTEAQAVQLRQFRALLPQERIRKACGMSRRGRLMAFDAIRRRYPLAAPNDVRLKYIELAYGSELADNVRRWQQERCM